MTVLKQPALFSRIVPLAALSLAASLFSGLAQAGPFEVAVAPSRFELSARNTQRSGQTMQIYNVGNQSTEVALRTLDWTLSDNGQLTLHDELLPGSCRPWVTLERRTLRLSPKSNTRFRFQIDVPVDAQKGECRFMIAVEGVDPAHQATINGGGASLNLPVSGRIAVAVYVALNGAKPAMEFVKIDTAQVQGKRVPVIVMRNNGNAHGRLEGLLEATTAQGTALELQPDGGPVLPGQTRALTFSTRQAGNAQAAVEPTYPLKVSGTLDWADGAFKVEAQIP